MFSIYFSAHIRINPGYLSGLSRIIRAHFALSAAHFSICARGLAVGIELEQLLAQPLRTRWHNAIS